MNRRRFLTITAAAAGTAMLPTAFATAMTRWQGVALGAQASIHLDHPDATRLIALARAEIARLEGIFSLYRADSELSRLNATGALAGPSFELLECLSLAGRVHATTGGMFDPTIQPLWALYAEHAARGGSGLPPRADRDAALARTGWPALRHDAGEVRLPPGFALSLNGIAQGYIADRVADRLRAEGLTNVLVDTGELQAVGHDPNGGAWSVGLRAGGDDSLGAITLTDAAVASSAPLGTVFDARGTVGHILDPHSGRPVAGHWQFIAVTAPRAAVADALSTAFCGMPRASIDTTLAAWPGASLAASVPAAG